MRILKTHENLQNPCNRSKKRTIANRTARKIHGVQGRQNECLITFAIILDFEKLCKSIGNYAHSLTSMKAMKYIWQAIKIKEDLWKSMKPMKIYENTWNRWRSIRSMHQIHSQLKPHYTECTRSARPPKWMLNKFRKHLWLWKSLWIH